MCLTYIEIDRYRNVGAWSQSTELTSDNKQAHPGEVGTGFQVYFRVQGSGFSSGFEVTEETSNKKHSRER